MRILSLFDGMACGMIAMQAAGIEVDRYVAYEIDKYAVQTSSHNFPMIEHRGDVFGADFSEFVGFDWLIGGSPCTYWSIAQKNNRETEASGIGWELFSQYVRALHEAQPKYFIYENNKSMSKQIRASIDEAFGFDAVLINSALVSAQNRQRLYWVGKRNADGTYSKVNVEQPINRGILLKDILENGCDLTSTAYYSTGQNAPHTLEKNLGSMAAIRVGALPRPNGELSTSQGMRVYSTEGKSINITASGGGLGGNTGLYAVPLDIEEIRIRDNAHIVINENAIRGVQNKNNASCAESFYEFTDRKANTMTTAHTPKIIESLEQTKLFAVPCEWDEKNIPTKAISRADGKTYQVHKVENGLITIKNKQYPIKLADGYYIIRKLTVSECKRLQTVPEWYEFPVSDTQAFKMLGNGWGVDVIVHLIKSTF